MDKINYRREAAHLAGSVMIGAAIIGLSQFVSRDIATMIQIWVGTALLLFIVTKEILEDEVSQPRLKTVLDVVFWVAPYTLIVWLCR